MAERGAGLATLGGWLDAAMSGLVALIIFTIMAVTAADVVGRYFFSAPMKVAYEVTQSGMALVIFGALPLVTARYEHVSTALFTHSFGRIGRLVRYGSVALTCAIACGIFAWRLWAQAGMDADVGTTLPVSHLPFYPVSYFMAVLAAATSIILAAQSIWILSGNEPAATSEPAA